MYNEATLALFISSINFVQNFTQMMGKLCIATFEEEVILAPYITNGTLH